MKASAIIATAAAAILGLLLLTSCSSFDSPEKLTQWANVAVTYAEVTGEITPKQAATLRQGGSLILDVANGKPLDPATISTIVVTEAVAAKKLTPEQAAALLAASPVALTYTAPPERAPEPNPTTSAK
jgi:hypothetical protein